MISVKRNSQLMKMLAALSLISTLAILHATSNLSPENVSEMPLRIKRNIKSIEDKPRLKLIKWFKSVRENSDKVLHLNLTNFQLTKKPPKFLLKLCVSDKPANVTEGLEVKNNQLEGEGIVSYEEDSNCAKELNIQSVKSNFVNGQANGPSLIIYSDGSYAKANFENGALNGYFIKHWCRFGSCDLLDLEAWRVPKFLKEISYFHNGHRIGVAIDFRIGGGFVVGEVDTEGELTGHDISYVFPDMETMLVGEFKKGLLSSGLEAELVDTKISENGIIKPLYEIKGQNVMKYLPANKTHTGDGPLISDPMEEKFYYVGNSSIEGAGRGMFLKKNAVKGQIVGFYNGVRMTDLESKVKVESRKSQYRIDNDWAKPTEILDIPIKFRDLKNYNATLGHLVNHSQKPNTWYGMFEHPRFGKIRSIVMLKDAKAGDELLVDYGYLQQYAASETAIRTLLDVSKWFSNMDDESFHSEMKYHIKYLRNKVDEYKPYLKVLKGISNFLQ